MPHNFDDEDDWHFDDAADVQVQSAGLSAFSDEERFEDVADQLAAWGPPCEHEDDVTAPATPLVSTGHTAAQSSSSPPAVLPVVMETPAPGTARRKRLRTRTSPANAGAHHDTPSPVVRRAAAQPGRPSPQPAEGMDVKKYNRMLCQLKYWHSRKVQAATNQHADQERPRGVDFRRLAVESKVALVREWIKDTTMGSEELKKLCVDILPEPARYRNEET